MEDLQHTVRPSLTPVSPSYLFHISPYSTGLGAVWKTCNVQEGATVAVFGLGAVGLAAIQAAKTRKASRIFAIDMNKAKFEIATLLGATECINPL